MAQHRILIVEDDPFLRQIYVDTLTKAGYAVDTAEDGDLAKEKVLQNTWNLVLMDIILPKTNGLDVVRSLREQHNFTPAFPIVFLTNLDNDDQIREARRLGNGYIIKSQITPGELLTKVASFLDTS